MNKITSINHVYVIYFNDPNVRCQWLLIQIYHLVEHYFCGSVVMI